MVAWGKKGSKSVIVHLIGCPGVGKSTLAEELARRTGFYLIREEFSDNPFLSESWNAIMDRRKDPVIAYSQFWFMGQYSRVLRMAPKDCIIEAGAMMGLTYTRALAKLGLLDDDVFKTLESNYLPLIQPGKKFGLVTDVDTIIDRIHSRNRGFENSNQKMLKEYLLAVSDCIYEGGATQVIADLRPDLIADRVMKELL